MPVSFRPLARLIAGALCASLAVPLMGATTTLLPSTTLVIFPFRSPEGADPLLGPEFIKTLGETLTTLGGVKVIMGDPATAQADYLHAAKADGGEYYLIGTISPPLNHAAPVIEQLVSVRSGTVVWADTAYINSERDIVDQGPRVKKAVVERGTRGYLAILNAPIYTPPPPKKGKNGEPEDLPPEAYGLSSKPGPPPKVYASASHPSRFVVLAIAGNAVPQIGRDYAVTALMTSLKRHGQTVAQGDPDTTRFPHVLSDSICKSTGAGYLVFGTVSINAPRRNLDTNNDVAWADAYLTPTVYDCGAQKLEQPNKPVHGGAIAWKTAVDRAADSAVTSYVLKVATVAKSS